jgi:4-diphosphocytidyl-2-C-methyl-D-erythritol kinase
MSAGPGPRATIVATTHAKVNLALEVIGRRPDGYHALRSVMAPLAFGDRLAVRVAVRGRDRLAVRGLDAGPPADNLVLRAAALLREEAADATRPLPPLAFVLRKRIPVAAGLGGGSSDAAAALQLAAAAWGVRLTQGRQRRLAASLGSDVPFFTTGGWVLVGGRGERMSPLPPPPGSPPGVLLVVPTVRLSTRLAFETWDRLAADTADTADTADAADTAGRLQPGATAGLPSGAHALAEALRRGADATALAALAGIAPRNDLWPAAAALVPGLAAFREEVEALLGRPVHLSGSGPTLFVLYPSRGGAARAARRVRSAAGEGRIHPPGASEPTVIATHTTGGSE